MEKIRQEKGAKWALWLSRCLLALALAAAVLTVRTCFPQGIRTVSGWLGLGENGRAQAAFMALRDALAEGDGVVEAFAETYQVFSGETP